MHALKRQRLIFWCSSLLCVSIAVLLMLQAFRENIVFFFSPSELAEKHWPPGKNVRVGGLVQKGSLEKPAGHEVTFVITDGKAALTIHYEGLLPNLFRESQGVVAEGVLAENGHFQAKTILAKHDETYMPREVAESLKKAGHWHGELPPPPPPSAPKVKP